MKWLFWFAGIVLIFAASWFVGRVLQQQDEMVFRPMTISPCTSPGVQCQAIFSDATLKFGLRAPVVVMSPVLASISSPADISDVYLQFRMQDMEMGVQRYELKKVEIGLWLSEVMLPVCTLGRSDWIATLDVKYQGTWWRGEFDFETVQDK